MYPDDTYGFSRDFDEIKRSFEKELDVSGLGYTDFGYVHCVDEESDLEAVLNGGLFDYMKSLRKQGVIHHLGFSSHTPSVALTPEQCLAYNLDRPAVLSCIPGAADKDEVKSLLGYTDASQEQKSYSVLGTVTPKKAAGRCVYCNHCEPCPAGIDIGLVNKYFDLAKIGDDMAAGHYRNLSVKVDACIRCGHCEERCPFKVKQMARMEEITSYFAARSV